MIGRLIVAMRNGQTASDLGVTHAEAAAVTIGLAGFAGQSMVDNLVNLPVICLLLIGVVAWVDGGLEASRSTDPIEIAATFSRGSPRALWFRSPGSSRWSLRPDPDPHRSGRSSAVAGNSAALRGDDAAALAAYDSAIEADGSFTLYHLQRGSALARLGRTMEALEEYRSASRSTQSA